MDALLNSLTEAELALVREAEPERMAGLDEDALAELHDRVRRARNKYVKVYRRRAAVRVAEAGGRGKARPQNARSRAKAEVFEDVLARVSQQLAKAARASAAALRAERLAEARQARNAAPPARPARSAPVRLRPQKADRQPDFTGLQKRHSSTRATGARRQARRDNR
jgi:hypothetical protein